MQKEQSKSTAALWMSGWLALMLVMVVAGREVRRELSVFHLMELRASLVFCFLLPVILLNGGLSIVKTRRLPWHAARNLIHYCAQLGWFYALTLIPIGQVVTIEFTMVIWAAILAALFLGEQMTPSKVAAIVLGLIGVVTIIRPSGAVNPGQLIALVAGVGFGISIALVKSLTRTENTLAIIFWMLVVQSVAGLVPTLMYWVPPSPAVWGWCVVIAVCGTFSHFCMARSMLYADATGGMPMDFLRVPLTATAGWLIYGERLDAFTVLGAALILAGNFVNLRASTARGANLTFAARRGTLRRTSNPK